MLVRLKVCCVFQGEVKLEQCYSVLMFVSIILVCDEISLVRFVGINFVFIFFSNLFIVLL